MKEIEVLNINQEVVKYWVNKLNVANKNAYFIHSDLTYQEREQMEFAFPSQLVSEMLSLSKDKDFNIYKLGITCLSILLDNYTTRKKHTITSTVLQLDDLSIQESGLVFLKIPYNSNFTARQLLKRIHLELQNILNFQQYNYQDFAEEFLNTKKQIHSVFDIGFVYCPINQGHKDLDQLALAIEIDRSKEGFKLRITGGINQFNTQFKSLFAQHFFQCMTLICSKMEDPLMLLEIGEESEINWMRQQFVSTYQQNPTTQNIKSFYPLSPAQNRMFILQHLSKDSTTYNAPFNFGLDRLYTPKELKAGIAVLVNRHESLRTSFDFKLSEPMQIVHSTVEFNLPVYQSISEATADFIQPFDLAEVPLFRIRYVLDEKEPMLFFDLHHIITDGISQQILGKELMAILAGENLPPVQLQYKDFVQWLNTKERQNQLKRQERFWLDTFAETVPLLDLPIDFTRPEVRNDDRTDATFGLCSEELQTIRHITEKNQSSTYQFLLTLWTLLIAKISNQTDVTVGTPVAGRQHPDLANVVGMFVNTLALRNHADHHLTFAEFLIEVKNNFIDAFDHQEYPFEKLVEEVWDNRITNRNPFFDTFFSLLWKEELVDLPTDEASEICFNHVGGNTKFDLSMDVSDYGNYLDFNLSYSAQLFKEGTIRKIVQYFRKIIDILRVEGDGVKLGAIDILSSAERKRLIHDFNQTTLSKDTSQSVIELFEEQAQCSPDAIALVFEEQKINYRELNEKANQLAHYLRRKGVKKQDLILIYIDRSVEMIIALLGILKAGGVYVPIDPNYPPKHISYIQQDARAQYVLTNKKYSESLEAKERVTTILIDTEEQDIAKETIEKVNIEWTKDDLLYVIYTSGSTGKSKGVMISQGNVQAFVHWCHEEFSDSPFEVVFAGTSICFDLSVFEIFYTLTTGKKIRLLESGLNIANYLKVEDQILINTVPSVITHLLEEKVDWSRVTVINMAGEPILPKIIESLDLQRIEVRNLYGPSEDTTYSTIYKFDEKSPILIGRPIANTQIYIVDDALNLLPEGVIGELCISGAGVSKGYLYKEELTAEKFVSNPFCSDENSRLYKTGDLARWLPNGNIDFIGRRDHQVKIRGYRIELEGIEAVLQKVPSIRQCVVTAKEDSDGNKCLIAYVVCQEEFDREAVVGELKTKLPEYMVPTIFMELDALPLTPNGKIDKKALPNPDLGNGVNSEYVEASNEVEEQLVKIWKTFLKIERVGVRNNFFELGGHSMIAVKIINRISKIFGLRISFRTFFENITIEELAVIIQKDLDTRQLEQGESYAMSPAQNRLFILHQLDEKSLIYNLPRTLFLQKTYTTKELHQVLLQVLQSHDSLRTIFGLQSNGLVQYVFKTIEFEVEDLSGTPISAAMATFVRPFDLCQGPLFRVAYCQNEEATHLLFDAHQIIVDETSWQILQRDIIAILNGTKLPTQRRQYRDFVELIATEKYQEQQIQKANYWSDVFAEEKLILDLPIDFARPEISSTEGQVAAFCFSKEDTIFLQNIAKQTVTDSQCVLTALWSILIAKLTSSYNVCIGLPVDGRQDSTWADVVGLFSNLLPICIQPQGDRNFLEFLEYVKAQFSGAYQNQDYPFAHLVEQYWDNRIRDRHPIFDTIVEWTKEELVFVNHSPEVHFTQNKILSNVDLCLKAQTVSEQWHFNLIYQTALFKAETIEQLVAYLRQIVQSLRENTVQPISQIELLTLKEKRQLMLDFNDTAVAFPENKTLIDLFEEQVARKPDNVALLFSDRQMTYRQLQEQSNMLAHVLQQNGVGPEVLVPICFDRSPEMFIAIMGVLKAGGAYVPIDPEYPQRRINYLVEDTQGKVVLTTVKYEMLFEDDSKKNILVWEKIKANEPNRKTSPKANIKNDNLAYVIYTSGSTGRPKGVLVEHASVVNELSHYKRVFNFSEEDRLLFLSNYVFDASVEQIFLTLTNGSSIVLVSKNDIFNPAVLERVIEEKGISHLHATPTLLKGIRPQAFSKLKRVCSGGETCSVVMADSWSQYVSFFNRYGPTETTINCTYYRYEPETVHVNSLPIGKPLSNTQVCILDQHQQLVPIGVRGELYIGGKGVTRGYLNNEALTLEKFVTLPFEKGARFYRTGDLALWSPNGNIIFKGRVDDQVKIRGYRIELGEIESVLQKSPLVNQCVVQAKEDSAGHCRLIAYVLLEQKEIAFDKKKMLDYLQSELPAYMLPSLWVELENMPLTPNGKVNRKALPVPDFSTLTSVEYVAPNTETEKRIANMWQELFEIEKVGIEDDFFELGGHSLLAIKICNRIVSEFLVKISLNDFFENTTVRSQAVLVDNSDEEVYKKIKPAPIRRYYELSPPQNRHFIVQSFNRSSTVYNVPDFIILEDELNKPLEEIQATIAQLVARHESLRTTFKIEDNELIQIIHPQIDFKVEHFREISLKEAMNAFVRPFDLHQAPLFRIAFLENEEEVPVLLVDLHHIITDGASQEILANEFRALLSKEQLPSVNLQYKDFVFWLKEKEQMEKMQVAEVFWSNKFDEPQAMLEFPTDFSKNKTRTFTGSAASFSASFFLAQEEMDILSKKSTDTGTTFYMLLLAIWTILLAKITNEEDITVGTPVLGRNHPDLDQVVGMFVNTLPIRNHPKKDKSLAVFLKEVKDNFIEAFDHQEFTFEKLVEKAWDGKNKDRNPIFDTMLTFGSNKESSSNVEKWDPNIHFIDEKGVAKFDLSLSAVDFIDQIEFTLSFNTCLFKKETIAKMIYYFRRIIIAMDQGEDIKIGEIDILSNTEKQRMLHEFNETTLAYNKEQSVVELFEAKAFQNPNAIALAYKNNSMSYRDLNECSNQLAHHLQSKGMQAQDRVLIYIDRSVEMIIGMLGILKAGGVYVPIDPVYPQDRITYIQRDANAHFVITTQKYVNLLEDKEKIIAILMDKDWPAITREPKNRLAIDWTPDDLLYVIYTSGSTGQPKGVMISQGNVQAFVAWCQEEFSVSPFDVVFAGTSICFDLSIFEIFYTLTTGKRIRLLENGLAIADYLDQEERILLNTVPSVIASLLEDEVDWSRVNVINMAGEPIPEKTKEALDLERIEVRNLYGPSEDTTYSTVFKLQEDRPILIGCPIANTQVYILDKNLNLLPERVIGELCISGAGVAKGYLNQEALTAEKFVVNPYGEGENAILYKTGDLARWLDDGNIEFIGRRDHQVKIRGYRIELGEIEAILQKIPSICQCVVMALEDQKGNKGLVAYVVTQSDFNREQVIAALKTKLPDYMIPSVYLELEKLPLTPNGKIDKEALPMPDEDTLSVQEYVAPRNELEGNLTELWQQFLLIEKIGIHDNFFDLGGHSILAMKLIAQLRKRFNNDLGIVELTQNPTIATQAAFLQKDMQDQENSLMVPLTKIEPRSDIFFMIPPILGSSIIFHSLGHLLEKKGIRSFGMQFRGFDREELFDNSIEQMALSFYREIDKMQLDKTKVIHILGYSMGCLIAFELVHLLETKGFTCKLVLLDRGVGMQKIDQQIDALSDEILESLIKDHLGALMDDFSNVEKNRIKRLIVHNLRLTKKYRLNKRIKAPILAIEAEKSGERGRMKTWQSYTENNLIHYTLDTDHFGILSPEFLQKNVAYICKFMGNNYVFNGLEK